MSEKEKECATSSTNEVKLKIDNGKEPKRKVWLDWIQAAAAILVPIVAFLGLFFAVPTAIKNANQQEQTQIVIEPRDGDIIVKDGDDYKLLQLINAEDVSFPSKVQEIQNPATNSKKDKRVDISNTNGEDWSNRDSFTYVINGFSINPNKVINLLGNIKSITVFCDFYAEKNISTFIDLGEKAYKFTMIGDETTNALEVTKANVYSEYEYVTNELNDGIEWVKIRVDIVYEIDGREVRDTITSDWIETDADWS